MHAQRLLTPNELPLIKTIEFKGKSPITTFSLNIRKLVFGRKFDCETIYNDFQNKVKEMYEKLYEIVQAFELEIPKEEANFDNLKKLEDELYNYVQSEYKEITSFDIMMETDILAAKYDKYTRDAEADKDKLLKEMNNKILKLRYIIETLSIYTNTEDAIEDFKSL